MVKLLSLAELSVCAISMVLAGCVFFPLGTITEKFDGNCLLYADIFLSTPNVSIDTTRTVYGDTNTCEYTTFINVAVCILSIVWGVFIIQRIALDMKDSAVLTMFAFLTQCTLFICVLVSSVEITNGFSSWCDSIERNAVPYEGETRTLSCSDYETLKLQVPRSKFYTYSLIAEVTTWVLCGVLLVHCVLLAIIIYGDYRLKTSPDDDSETSEGKETELSIMSKETDGFYSSVDGEDNENFYAEASDDRTRLYQGGSNVTAEVVVHGGSDGEGLRPRKPR